MRKIATKFQRVPDHQTLVARMRQAARATIQSNVPPRPYYIVIDSTPELLIVIPYDESTLPVEFWWGEVVSRDKVLTMLVRNGNTKTPIEERREVRFVEYEDALAVRDNWLTQQLVKR